MGFLLLNYTSFDNPVVKIVNVEQVLSIYESLYPVEGERYVFFDESQYTDRFCIFWTGRKRTGKAVNYRKM